MEAVRQTKLERAYSKIIDDSKNLHISGEPGIGKTNFLSNLQDRLPDDYRIQEKTVCEHHEPDDLETDLLNLARKAANQRDLQPNQLTSLSFGLPSVFSGGATKDDRERDLHKLESLTADWSGAPLIIFLDDIHKIADDETVVCDVISEFSASLGNNVYLVTAGQISASRIDDLEDIHLNLYTRDQTRHLLEETFDGVTDDHVKEIHSTVQGHPLYLRLLTEFTDDIDDLYLPEDEVFTTIEERYIENLSPKTEQFLRQVAPLPELDEKTCHGIVDDFTLTDIERMLRTLSQRSIVQKVYRTEDGDNIYKIHEVFRDFLARKHQNQEEVHRNALQYHINQIAVKIPDGDKEAWVNTIPHSFYARLHLGQIYGKEIKPEHFFTELDQTDLTYPLRGLIVFYTSVGIMTDVAPDIWELELPVLRDWLEEEVEHEAAAELLSQLVEWYISQHQEDPKQLEEIEIEADIDELLPEDQSIAAMDISEEHAQQLRTSREHFFRYFVDDEPHRNKEHKAHAVKMIDRHGISLGVINEFRSTLWGILSDSEIGEEFDDVVESYQEGMGAKIEEALLSRVDMHQLSDDALELAQELLENLHYNTILSSGIMEDLAIEGGEVLEAAENPGFAMIWYALTMAYFREHDPNSTIFEEIKKRYLEQLELRREYEQDIENPMINAEDASKSLVLEDSDNEDRTLLD